MDYYRCPSCDAANEEHLSYCKNCGTWMIDAKRIKKRKRKSRTGSIILVVIALLFVFGVIGYVTQEETDIIDTSSFTPKESQSNRDKRSIKNTEIGLSRDNPAPLGTRIESQVEIMGDRFATALTVVETIRGDEALKMLREANQFNSDPSDGAEYLLAKIKIEAIENESDAQLQASGPHFTLVSTAGSDYSPAFVVAPEPILDARLYEGADSIGWVAFEVNVDDEIPLISIARDFQGRGGLWFSTK